MKQLLLFAAIALAIASCKKETLTPCGNEVDNYNFTHSANRTDSTFVIDNTSDRNALVYIQVYKNNQCTYQGPSPQDTVQAATLRIIPFSSIRKSSDTTEYFNSSSTFDSIIISYSVYIKACSVTNGTDANWEWRYSPIAKRELIP